MATMYDLINNDRHMRSIELNDFEGLVKYPSEYKANDNPIKCPIIKSGHEGGFKAIAKNVTKFNELFYDKFNILIGFDFSNVLIAGGCITSLLTNTAVKDIDIFFYGLTPDSATNRMIDIIEQLEKKADSTEKLIFIKNKYNLTVSIGKQIYQFIFRCYKSISQILHGFDIPSSAIGFDGKQLYTTTIGDFAFTTGLNIIDLTKYSPTYEKRLIKYTDRGFGIAMPDLNITKLAAKLSESKDEVNWIKFGKLMVRLSKTAVKENSITSYDFKVNTKIYGGLSEYTDPFGDNEGPDYNAINWMNINRIINNKLDQVIYTGSNLIRLNVFGEKYVLGKYKNMMEYAYDNGKIRINARVIANLNPTDDVGKIINWILTEDKKTYDLFVEKRVLDIQLIMQNLKYEISWITKNPGIQGMLSSSINPITITSKEWYGKYLIEQ